MTAVDYQGVATIIVAVGTLAIQFYNTWRGARRDAKIAQVHDLVDGMAHELKASDKALSRAEGKVEGIAEERADPMSPAGS